MRRSARPLPTITALREEGAKVILMAHLGRPKGKVVPELSLAPVAARLGELLGITVPLAADTYGEDAQAKVAAMNDGDVLLLSIEQVGGIACHTGRESCFFNELKGDRWIPVDPVLKDPKEIYK